MSRGKQVDIRPEAGGASSAHEVFASEDGYRVVTESAECDVRVSEDGPWSVLTPSSAHEAIVSREDGVWVVTIEGERFRFLAGDERSAAAETARAPRADVKAPMPGKVVKLLASVGDTVEAGQGILLFEAMKMQNEVRSPQDGILSELDVSEGDAVEARDRLFVVKSD